MHMRIARRAGRGKLQKSNLVRSGCKGNRVNVVIYTELGESRGRQGL